MFLTLFQPFLASPQGPQPRPPQLTSRHPDKALTGVTGPRMDETGNWAEETSEPEWPAPGGPVAS